MSAPPTTIAAPEALALTYPPPADAFARNDRLRVLVQRHELITSVSEPWSHGRWRAPEAVTTSVQCKRTAMEILADRLQSEVDHRDDCDDTTIDARLP